MEIDRNKNPQRSQPFSILLLGVLTAMLTLALFAALEPALLPKLPAITIAGPLQVVHSTDAATRGTTLERSTRGYLFPPGRHRLRMEQLPLDAIAVLAFDRTDLSAVSLVKIDADGSETLTTIERSTRLDKRPLGTRVPAFDLTAVDASDSSILLEVETDYAARVNIKGWASVRDFTTQQIAHNRLTGFYFGTTFALLLLSLLVYLSTHRQAYVYYAIFLTFHAITILGYEGIYAGTALGKPSWIHPLFFIAIPLTVVFALKFLESLLQLREKHPQIQRFVGPFRCCFYPLILAQLALLPWPAYWPLLLMVQNLLVLAGAVIYPVVVGIVAVNGKREHQVIYVAFIPHSLAVALYVTHILGWSPPDPLFYYKLLTSTFIEMLLIAVALGFLMRSLRDDKDISDANAITHLKRAIAAEEAYRNKLESKVIERTAALEQSDQEKKRLFEIISHDLRAPLSSMNAYSTMSLEDGEAGEHVDYRQTLIDVSQASRSLYDLLENLLSWAKTNWDNIQPKKDSIDLHEVVQECLNLYRPHIREKNIRITMRIEQSQQIFADQCMLQTILRNVFSNALRHTDEGGYLEIAVHPGPHQQAAFRIKNGPQQIPQAIADEINLETAAKELSFSKGLGLRLCRAMSKRNDWNFRIEPVADGTLASFEVATGSAKPVGAAPTMR